MGTETIKSASITLRDAGLPTMMDNRLNSAVKRTVRGVCTITTGTDVGSTYNFFSVPTRGIPISLRLSAPDIGSTTTLKIGLFRTTANGGTAVDDNLFAALQTVKDGAQEKTEILRQATTITVAHSEWAFWQLAAETVDPGGSYDVVATTDGAANGTGAVLLEMEYTV